MSRFRRLSRSLIFRTAIIAVLIGSGLFFTLKASANERDGFLMSLALFFDVAAEEITDDSDKAESILPMEIASITTMTLDTGSNGDVGQYSSQAIVNGNPAISYYDMSEGKLMFARNSSSDGSGAWTITIADSTRDVGRYMSLAVVNGNPAICYYDNTNADLKFVRAADASGTTWGTPITVDSTGNVGWYTSLAVVNGNPAVSYYDATNSDLKYVRAIDASGISWGAPLTLDSTGTVGYYTSLEVINGNPAVGYYDASNGSLKYVRACGLSCFRQLILFYF